MAPFLLCASMRRRLWLWAVFVGKYVCCRSWTQPSAGELSVKTTEAPHGPGCLQQQEPGCRDTLKQTHILLTWLRLLLMSGSMSESTLVKVSGKSVNIIDQLSTVLKFFGTSRFDACRQNFFVDRISFRCPRGWKGFIWGLLQRPQPQKCVSADPRSWQNREQVHGILDCVGLHWFVLIYTDLLSQNSR